MKFKDLLDYFSYLVLLLAFGIMIFYAYMSYYPFEILKFDKVDENGNGVYEVLTPEVKGGEILMYRSDFTKLMDIPATMQCAFEDGIIYQVSERANNNTVGDHNEVRAVDVPVSLVPETYRYTCRVIYKLTMGRTIEYNFYTEPFTVK